MYKLSGAITTHNTEQPINAFMEGNDLFVIVHRFYRMYLKEFGLKIEEDVIDNLYIECTDGTDVVNYGQLDIVKCFVNVDVTFCKVADPETIH